MRELSPTGEEYDREHHGVNQEEIPELTRTEILTAAKRMAPGKAPGPDGIPPEVTRTFMKKHPEVFKQPTEKILRSGEFPSAWKTAKLIFIPKPNKKDAYRPICLLNTIAKAVETIINRRLQTELEDRLSETQYGLRQDRSTLQAIREVVDEVYEEKSDQDYRRSNMCALILLDVENAFNSVEWRVVLEALKKKKISPYLQRLISSYLRDRWIAKDGNTYRMSAGVPQGSMLGPTLWNVAYDEVLRLRMPIGVRSLAYADDLALLVKARTREDVEQAVNERIV